MKKLILVLVVLLVSSIFAVKCRAASFDEAMTAVSASLPQGADVASMGNIGTLEDFTSSNPAVTAIVGEGNFSSTVNYGYFSFEKTRLQTVSASLGSKLSKNAFLQVGVGHAESPMKFIDEANAFRIKKNDGLSLQLGAKVASNIATNGDELYLGVGYGYAQSEQEGIALIPFELGIWNASLSSETKTQTATLGVAYKPIKKVTVGAFGSRSWNRSHYSADGERDPATYRDFSDVLHVGFSAKVLEGTTVAADYQHVSFSDSDTQFDQYFAGIEQYIVKDTLALYGGYANGAPTAGLGVYLKNGGLNLSYSHDLLKETKQYLGSCDAYMASVYVNF